MKALRIPILGVIAAIAITSTMDATGYFLYSALPLLPLWWSRDRASGRTL